MHIFLNGHKYFIAKLKEIMESHVVLDVDYDADQIRPSSRSTITETAKKVTTNITENQLFSA